METLRSEIRAAFEREQAANPPVASLRRTVIQAVIVERRHAPNLQWLAIAAAILLAILVVAGLMSTRFNHRASVPAGPEASPVADYGPPPAGVLLLYVHDPNHPTWLIAFDWSGKPRGTVKLGATTQAGSVNMAPDGQSFATGLGAKGGNWEFLDRLGTPVTKQTLVYTLWTQLPGQSAKNVTAVAPTLLPGAYSTMWADDNQHVCTLTVDQARDPNVRQTGVRLAACSFHNDYAIAVRTTIAWPSEYWVVRLSDGKVLTHYSYTAGDVTITNIVPSSDGTLIAENSSQSVGGQVGTTAPKTLVRRVADRVVVSTLDPSMGVLAFSGDNSVALVTLSPMVGGQVANLALIDLQTGQTVWHGTGTTFLPRILAQPGGSDFALVYLTRDPAQAAAITIIHRDGSVTQLPQDYVPTW